MLVHTVWYGTFLLEMRGGSWEVAGYRDGPGTVDELVLELEEMARGGILDREEAILKEGGITHVSDERLLPGARGCKVVPMLEIAVPSAAEKGYDLGLLTEANIRKARRETATRISDSNILSTVGGLTDVDTALNLLTERVRE